MDPNIRKKLMTKCLICEKEIEAWEPKYPSTIKGGTIDVSFGFGSQYDCVGLRKPKYSPSDPILKDKPGYTAVDVGKMLDNKPNGKIAYYPSSLSDIETVPGDNIPKDRKDLQIASSYYIRAAICDSCFAKKIDFFTGSEKGEKL